MATRSIRAAIGAVCLGLGLLAVPWGPGPAAAPETVAPGDYPVASDARLGGDDTHTRLVLDLSRKIDLRVYLAFAAIYILWGSTYLAIRIAVQQVPPLFAAGRARPSPCPATRRRAGSRARSPPPPRRPSSPSLAPNRRRAARISGRRVCSRSLGSTTAPRFRLVACNS